MTERWRTRLLQLPLPAQATDKRGTFLTSSKGAMYAPPDLFSLHGSTSSGMIRWRGVMNLPNVELVAAKVHAAWMANKLAAGVTSRKLESGEELMVPYEELSEEAKDLDRASVKTVYQAIQNVISS